MTLHHLNTIDMTNTINTISMINMTNTTITDANQGENEIISKEIISRSTTRPHQKAATLQMRVIDHHIVNLHEERKIDITALNPIHARGQNPKTIVSVPLQGLETIRFPLLKITILIKILIRDIL